MDTETAAPETKVPIKVPQPEDNAPPTLAEPASGPVAEMSGALAEQSNDAAPAATDVTPPTANGDVGSATAPPAEAAPAAPATATDGDEKDNDESVPAAAPAAEESTLEANGTPATAKKGGNGKRKSIGGVPEHKSKKLNKKKSVAKITHLDAKPGDYYFARLKSYPPWPSIICDEEMLPQTLLSTRPQTTMKPDGTYKEDYTDGGKKVSERTFPVMFLFTNEFAWIPNTDLAPLIPNECKEVTEKGKGKALVAAYHVAAEDHDLQYFKDMLVDHARAIQEDEDLREAREAEKAAKAEKKKQRKSIVKTDTEDVEMEDAESELVAKKPSKKRKKEAEDDDDETEKTPKTTKLKLTTNKTPATTEKKPKEKTAKPKSEKRKSKAAVSDEEMAEAPEEEPEKALDPVEARKAREKEVLFLRHKLQKGFLSRDQAPLEDEMPQMSNFIKKLENYGDLEVSIIRGTKINKVLKALIKLNTIPKDEEFNFRKRSIELLGRWNRILGAEPSEGDSLIAGDKDSKSTPTTNGVHDEKAEEETEEKKDEVEVAPEKQMEPSEAVEKVSGEVDADAGAKAEAIESIQKDETSAADEPVPAKAVPDTTATATIEKAPESAEAAAEAQDVVKATE